MAAIIDTGLLTAGLRSEFLDRLSGTPTVWQDLATTIKSNKDREAYKFLGSVPPMREWGTGRLARGLRTESYDVTNQKYELTLEVDRDELSDDQTGQIKIRIGEMAARAAQHKDLLIAELLANGGETGYHSYDGVPFFSGSHVSGNSGTQDNDLTFDCVAATDPTVAEFKAAVKQAMQAMLGFKDDQGEPMSAGATGMTLVVAPGLYFTALEAMNATLIGNTDNVLKGAARVVAFPRITNPAVFYLCKTDGVVRPLVFQDREPLEFNELTERSETGFLREVFLYGVRARYTMTYGYWQYAVRTTLETAE
jgi:phage major head subunit gpT-like protein